MMDIAKSGVAFVLECDSVEFCLENEGKAIALMPVPGGRGVPISVVERNGQPHLVAHLPFNIRGRAAWRAYRFFCVDEAAFGLGIDCSIGKTTYFVILEASTVEELEEAMRSSQAFLSASWSDLERFAGLSAAQPKEDAEAFDVSGLIREELASICTC